MTIAVGFRCSDGVVLATDSQYSQDITKMTGKKIFPLWSNGEYAMTLAGSGGADNIKAIVRDVEVALKDSLGSRETSSAEIQQIVENVLPPFYAKHIDCAPPEVRGDLEVGFMVGIWTKREGTKLFSVCRTTITEVQDYQCIGAGSYLTEYVSQAICPRGRLSVEQTIALAAYIVWAAKKYVDFCGGPTFVRALLDDGKDVRVDGREVEAAEEYMVDLFQSFGSLLGHLGSSILLESIDMGPFARILRDKILEFRGKQAAFREMERNRSGRAQL